MQAYLRERRVDHEDQAHGHQDIGRADARGFDGVEHAA